MVEFLPPFLLLSQNKSAYLQCVTFDTGEDGSPNNFAAGIFYVHSSSYITYGSDPRVER